MEDAPTHGYAKSKNPNGESFDALNSTEEMFLPIHEHLHKVSWLLSKGYEVN